MISPDFLIIMFTLLFAVTNDLQPQARYSIRGLTPNTNYELKVTAHNHAGSTTIR